MSLILTIRALEQLQKAHTKGDAQIVRDLLNTIPVDDVQTLETLTYRYRRLALAPPPPAPKAAPWRPDWAPPCMTGCQCSICRASAGGGA